MNQTIDKQSEQAYQEMQRIEKIEHMLAGLNNELSELMQKTQEAKAAYEKENNDYEKLTGKSFSARFYSVLGKLDDRTEKERREAAAARLKYDQYLQEVSDIEYQISKLTEEKETYGDPASKYDRLYQEKRQQLMNMDSSVARRMMELDEQINNAAANLREIEEALNAGEAVRKSLDEALKSLGSAEGWGIWDMFGGGMVTDLIKHSHLDKANDAAQQIQSQLRVFRTELTDVKIDDDINLEINGFAKFADFFLDGFIADWFMQNKINSAQENLTRVKSQVDQVMEKLSELEQHEQENLTMLQKQLQQMIIKT